MKAILTCLGLFALMNVSAQSPGISINSDGSNADGSAILDVKSSSKGFLMPRMTEEQKNAVSNPASGLMIFQTDGESGFYFYDGTSWSNLSKGEAWAFDGNAGTSSGIDFIGTTDAQDLEFRTNNINRMRLTQSGQIELLNTGSSVFVGEGAGNSDDLSANQNVFVGYESGFSNTTGFRNTAIGMNSMRSNSIGYHNTSIGYGSMNNITGGYQNTSNGYLAMNTNTTGARNSVVGYQGLYKNTIGQGNTAVGWRALYNNTSGTYNTAIGFGTNSVGSIYSNSTGIGYNADNTASNSVVVGNGSVTSIGGQVGWTTLSDGRFKKNVRNDEVRGLDFITALQPVTYNYDLKAKERWCKERFGDNEDAEWEGKYEIEQMRFSGFIAQEVEKAAELLGYEFSGVDAPKNENDIYGLRYSEFVVPLVKSVQELNEELQSKSQKIAELEQQNKELLLEVEKNSERLKNLESVLQLNKK